MTNLGSNFKTIAVLIILVLSAAGAFGQAARPYACLNKIGQREWAILLKDVDPVKKKAALENTGAWRSQVDGLRQMLAFSCEAVKLGLTGDKTIADELRNIRSEAIAVEYDKRFHKTGSQAPFSTITDAQIAKFYSSSLRQKEVERFLQVKLEMVRRGDPEFAGKIDNDEARQGAKDLFARIKISENSAALLGEPFLSAAEFNVRLQQAQFLARLVSEELAKGTVVSDGDVQRYIATHSELDSSARKAKATKILERAKAGENFAALADEFSEDPGNTSPDGKKNGGLYKDVPGGMMLPPFETASLALQPGEISPGLVESDYGFHVIKLENKSADGKTYDVRHVLITTGYKDPDDPNAKEVPLAVFVRGKLEAERQEDVIKRVVAENAVVIENYNPTPIATSVKRVARRKKR